MRRSLRLKPPLLVLAVAVAAVVVVGGFFVFGLPGPCGGGGILDDALQNHPGIQAAGAGFFILGGSLSVLLGAVWIVAVLVVRRIDRFSASR